MFKYKYRTREEIVEEEPGTYDNLESTVYKHQKLILEVLLDIRDILLNRLPAD